MKNYVLSTPTLPALATVQAHDDTAALEAFARMCLTESGKFIVHCGEKIVAIGKKFPVQS